MKDRMEPFDPNIALRIAQIIGPSSAAARSLLELTERLARGEMVGLFKKGSTFIVGPDPQSPIERFEDGAREGMEEQ